MIFDGLADKTVNRALDEQSDRIDPLMFTRAVLKDDACVPLRDLESD